MRSLSYYLMQLVIRLKGVKKQFSQDPIDYKELRREDVRGEKFRASGAYEVSRLKVAASEITEIKPKNSGEHLVLFCHGGAFVYGPVQHHWDAVKKIAAATNCIVWMIDYPKAPENKIEEISENIDEVYKVAVKRASGKIILIGDSVGGTLITALTQRLIEQQGRIPDKLVLISPVMDSTFSNSRVPAKDEKDPILSKKGVLSAKRMAAGDNDLEDIRMSPVRGSFNDFPPVLLFLAENDISEPDQQLAAKKMRELGVDLKIIEGEGMPHIWPILPVLSEGKTAMKELLKDLREVVQ